MQNADKRVVRNEWENLFAKDIGNELILKSKNYVNKAKSLLTVVNTIVWQKNALFIRVLRVYHTIKQ